jgi:hypothetical protein
MKVKFRRQKPECTPELQVSTTYLVLLKVNFTSSDAFVLCPHLQTYYVPQSWTLTRGQEYAITNGERSRMKPKFLL